MNTNSWVPRATLARVTGHIGGVGQTELTGAGLDQGEQVVAVLRRGEFDPDPL